MIQIYYSYSDILIGKNLNSLVNQMPEEAKTKLQNLRRDEDKDLLILSFVLLNRALDENGFNRFKISEMEYTETGRPFFNGSHFDFNISHTDNCAALVFSSDFRVGIDIEKIKEIDFSDFTHYFTADQWNQIHSAEDKYEKFYYYWTIIESAVKADGRGLQLTSGNLIKLINSNLLIENVKWFYQHYNFDQTISCCITADKEFSPARVKNITSI